MNIALSEEEQNHVYSCLLVGNAEFAKIKKSLAKLNREDDKVDNEINLNAQLRRQFNPRAEEEARERARAKSDPAQIDITEEIRSSGETGGGHPAGERVKLSLVGAEEVPPTDVALRDILMTCGFMVLLSDIRGWTSSERDEVVKFANAVAPDPFTERATPECLDLVAMTEERVQELNRVGPYTTRSLPLGADDAETVQIILPVDKEGEDFLVNSEFVDGVEAEIMCARMNREQIRRGDMDDELVTRWLVAGPWEILCDVTPGDGGGQEHWFAVNPTEVDREAAESEANARGIAARYNRTIAGRESDGSWKEPPPPKLSADDLQEIHAAAEAE